MRIENSIKIAKAGIMSQVVTMLLGFLNRIVFIKFLGSDYLGFSGLFTSILSMLALTELGLGSAIVYNLYKPIYDEDKEQIGSLVNYYKKIYIGLGMFVLIIGLLFVPFLQVFIKDISELQFSLNYIRFIYLLSLLESVSSYLFVYRTTLLTVSQKEYIITNINTISNIILAIVRIFILVFTNNYVIYLIAGLIFRIGANYIASRYAIKHFPYIREKKYRCVQIDKKQKRTVLQNAGNLSVHTLSAYIVNSTDSLIISTFVGIAELGMFSNYNLIFSTIRNFISNIVGSIQAPLGDLVTSGNKHRVREILNITTHSFYILSSFSAISLAALSSTFIELLFGQQYVMGTNMVLICSINVFVWTMIRPIWKLSAVTGLFKDDRINAIIEAVSNAVISIIAVQFYGITGTFFGTLCSYIFAFVLKTRLQFRKYFATSSKKYFIRLCQYTFLFVIELALVLYLTNKINEIMQSNIGGFFINCIICVIVPNTANFYIYKGTNENRYLMDLIQSKILKNNKKCWKRE